MNKFNYKEFEEICDILKASPFVKEARVTCETDSYFNKVKNSLKTDRRGEVAFCVIRPSGKIIIVTCEEYPQGVFRIPTGGIGHEEDIINAVYRETKEELGLDAEIRDFAGVLKIKLEFENDSVMFYSYLFIMKETGGRLLEDAVDDELSEVREVDLTGLEEAVDKLCSMKDRWKDWGMFRYASSKAFLDYLKSKE